MDLMDILTAGTGGGLIGIFGNIANRFVGMWEHKQKMEELRFKAETDKRKDDHEINLLRLEMESTARETEHSIELANVQGDWDIKKASYALPDDGDRAGPIASFIRTTMRPFLTYGLLMASAVFVGFGVGGESVRQEFILSTISMGSMCVAWWFGERSTMRTKA
jgi:hypothetical protein